MRALPFLLALAAAQLPAASSASELTASLGLSSQVLTDRAFDMVSKTDHLPMLRVAGGWRTEVPAGKLELDLGFSSGSTSERLHGTRTAGLWLRGLALGGTYRYPLRRFFEPYARLEASWEWATLSLDEDALYQRVGAPSGLAMLGFQLPVAWTVTGGVPRDWVSFDFGMGWALRADYAFDALAPEPPERPDADAIPRAPLSLGTLPLSGLSYRLGFTVRI